MQFVCLAFSLTRFDSNHNAVLVDEYAVPLPWHAHSPQSWVVMPSN